jgi:hypothetical protein
MKYSTEKGKNIAKAKRMPIEEFIRRANIKHNNQYTYNKVVYLNAHTHVTITCPIHGNWNQAPMDHLTGGHGCPQCGNIKKGISKKIASYQKFLILANKKHQGKYTYIDKSFVGITKPMTIVCPVHGEFIQTPDVHKRSGCQRCGHGPISESSQQWLDSLGVDKKFREIWISTPSKRIKVDAHDHLTNTVYEYLGDYWHGNPLVYESESTNSNNKRKFGDLYKETIERLNLIKSLGYNLIYIWEKDWLFSSIDNSSTT